MLYIAFVMILVGVLCFLYVSFSSAEDSKQGMNPNFAGNLESSHVQPGRRRNLMAESQKREVLMNTKDHSSVNQEMEARILAERSFSQPRYDETDVIYTNPVAEIKTTKPDVVESVEILGAQGQNLQPQPESRLSIQGLLFTDTKGKIPFEEKHFKELQFNESSFDDLKRIGEGVLNEENGRLIFQVKNQSFTYEPRDLKQIVFLDEAVVFLPSRNDIPSPVFFTESADELKAFFAQAEEKLA
ncbi:MAG: hypothetical protein GW938_02740 [Leptospira sp.]|nr:hypothetical protein [Leptospira sp.]